MIGDRRRVQQHGWITRTFNGVSGGVKTTTLPVPECAEDRVVGVWFPQRDQCSEMGEKLLISLLAKMRVEWDWYNPDDAGTFHEKRHKCGLVYRVLIGKDTISSWVDVPLGVMAGRIAYRADWDRVVGVIEHPDSILAARGGKKSERKKRAGDMLETFGRIVRGEESAVDHVALDCIACAMGDFPETATRWHVTEIDRNGLGLCAEHSGWDLRPDGQKWVQQGLGFDAGLGDVG